jgi:hypothetical protein
VTNCMRQFRLAVRSLYFEIIRVSGLRLAFPACTARNCALSPRINYTTDLYLPITVVARSQVLVCSRSLAGIAGSNPAGGMDVSCECCVLSKLELSALGLITRPEESYRVWFV